MSIEQAFLAMLSAASLVLGWFARELYQATKDLRRDLSALEVQIGKEYVRYDRMQDAMQPIMQTLNEIKHTLEKKVDKL